MRATKSRKPSQSTFEFRTWGGRRRGAGRKPAQGRRTVPHLARAAVARSHPVHVTFRMAAHVWNLRTERAYRVIHGALRDARRRGGLRVVHFTVLGNHLHLITESDGPGAFSSGVRGLSIRLAKRLNRLMGRRGPVFVGRFDAHVLRTPAEARNAVRYVLGNYRKHAAAWGEAVNERWIDPFSSASGKAPRDDQLALFPDAAASEARTWLLRMRAQETSPAARFRAKVSR